jgi:hypothetical protein
MPDPPIFCPKCGHVLASSEPTEFTIDGAWDNALAIMAREDAHASTVKTDRLWTIYCHTLNVDGRRYIGQTKTTREARWGAHVRKGRTFTGW